MEKEILVGSIVGLTIGTSIYIYNSSRFNKAQKGILIMCFVFPPLQWVLMLIILGSKSLINKNSSENVTRREVKTKTATYEDSIDSLRELKNSGILSEEEYRQKIESLENLILDSELRLSEDYKKLKNLFDNGVLNDQEFKNKIELLKKKYTTKGTESTLGFRVTEEVSEGYYVIMDDDMRYGFADGNYIKTIDTKYQYVESFKEGLALVRLSNKFGYIDKYGRVKISLIYDNAESFKNGLAKVRKGGKIFYIDKNGKEQ